MEIKFRDLRADEVEARIGIVKDTGVSLLLYKDARCDQNLLDETFGIFGWQRSHQLIDGDLYCTVSVKDTETGEWVAKQDVGTESYTEKEKGRASDSFKRACFNLGIGRELYTAPFIWIPSSKCEIKSGKCNTAFDVASMSVENKKITQLTIINAKNGEVVFEYNETPNTKKAKPKSKIEAKIDSATPSEEVKPSLNIKKYDLGEDAPSIDDSLNHVLVNGGDSLKGKPFKLLVYGVDLTKQNQYLSILESYAQRSVEDKIYAQVILNALADGKIAFTAK